MNKGEIEIYKSETATSHMQAVVPNIKKRYL